MQPADAMRVLIADDHPLFREGLRALLEARGVDVVGVAQDGQQAVELAQQLQPDVVLMDLQMPIMDGLTATRLISAAQPETRVVILTASEHESDLFEAIKSGAQGFILKNLEPAPFFDLLQGVMRGEPALTPALARRLLSELARPSTPARTQRGPDELTEREQEVLQLLVQGVTSNRELAERLVVTENTVKYHLRNILDKLHVQNRAQVVAFALQHGLVPRDRPEST